MVDLTRRSVLFGLAAPVIVRAASLMPIRGIVMPTKSELWSEIISAGGYMYSDLLNLDTIAVVKEIARCHGVKPVMIDREPYYYAIARV